MAEDLIMLYCSLCARECLAEAPPCAEGHGADCPERVCVECGAAVFVGITSSVVVAPPRRSRQAA